MKRTNLRKATGIAALALTASFGLAACGSDNSSAKASDDSMGSSTSASADDAGSQTFGPGCSAIPASGDGSFNGMATAPVASAASANPLLKTLVAAVTKAGLVDTLNSADALTVFAPTDDAFAKIPAATLNKVLADKATLTAILTHHVLAGQLDPSAVVGTHDTLNKDQVTVDGDTNGMTVENGDTAANVLCGNIPTSNATVYVIDSVLMPS
ncbi:fasciclin domain-containing protein [Nocardioides sp. LS1]|uniref:fasciclin domain-containing protein n=1 Tax=Nocardioides sp. LS1 TaxID=1027620 RepID=UPI000F61AB2D|nr:fasciclin domain-containing protein [Nocardioides sp. LS1]GCD90377.1 lipoprotein [Nocardioides sp. LS1]